MQIINNFFEKKGWFMGNVSGNQTGFQVAFKQGKEEVRKGLHFHKNSRELYIVLIGTAEVIINDKTIAISKGSIIEIEPLEKHELINRSEDFQIIMIMDRYIEGDTFPA